jgi:hypothetical protein
MKRRIADGRARGKVAGKKNFEAAATRLSASGLLLERFTKIKIGFRQILGVVKRK